MYMYIFHGLYILFFWHKMYILCSFNPNHFSAYFLNISCVNQSIPSLFKNVNYTFLEEFVWKKGTEALAWPHIEVEIQESFRSKLFKNIFTIKSNGTSSIGSRENVERAELSSKDWMWRILMLRMRNMRQRTNSIVVP